jgi:rfaE bifunctional protein nucleotidyltransferase chain/domain
MRGDRHDEAFAGASGMVVSDYGRGMAELPWVRNLLTRSQAPVVWDPHPRGAVPVRGLRLVTPNLAELQVQIPPDRSALRVISTAAQQAAARWAAPVAVTLGERGALLVTDGSPPLAVPAVPAGGSDSCGAGDCFAVTAARRLAGGALTSEAVVAAVAEASRFVAAGGSAGLAGRGFAGRAGVAGAAGLAGDNDVAGRAGAAGAARPLVSSGPEQAAGLAAAIRSQGGTVVAAGGCFDLLHAGHVQLLTAARALGDLLIVCLNSDASVRRLKGAGRPVVPATDRAATLAALACVDAVAIFEEDTPLPLLEALRPDVFVKGGDYGAVQIPESAALARWGGQTLVVPYLSGRSTSALLHRVADV